MTTKSSKICQYLVKACVSLSLGWRKTVGQSMSHSKASFLPLVPQDTHFPGSPCSESDHAAHTWPLYLKANFARRFLEWLTSPLFSFVFLNIDSYLEPWQLYCSNEVVNKCKDRLERCWEPVALMRLLSCWTMLRHLISGFLCYTCTGVCLRTTYPWLSISVGSSSHRRRNSH